MKKIFFAACLLVALVATVNRTTHVVAPAQTNESAFLNGNNDLAAPDVSPPVAVNTNNNVNCPTGWTRNEHCISPTAISTSAPPATTNNVAVNANEKRNYSGNIQSDQGDANKDVANISPPVTIVKESKTTVMAVPKDGNVIYERRDNATNTVACGFINNAEFNIRS